MLTLRDFLGEVDWDIDLDQRVRQTHVMECTTRAEDEPPENAVWLYVDDEAEPVEHVLFPVDTVFVVKEEPC